MTETFDHQKVWFVGAGPGDKSLITLKGYRALQQADIVIYAGSLINHELLDDCKADAALYDSATMTLDDITQLMIDGVSSGKLVVRLQTGDLSLYGSIREQSEVLSQHNIPFSAIPGVSSFLGAAAALGVEYTVPEVSQSLIITRIEGRTPMPPKESLRSFAAHQTSMAIFLSVQDITGVVTQLTEGGYDESTPVAVVYKATWPECQILRGTLSGIAQQVREAKIHKTALILVGAFLGDEYHYSRLYDAGFSHEYRSAIP